MFEAVERVGTMMFYARVGSGEDIKHLVSYLEAGGGNVIIAVTPIYRHSSNLESVFFTTATEAKTPPAPGTTNAV